MKQNDSSSIDYKSSKSEIWSAYKKLKESLEKGRDIQTPAKPKLGWREQLLNLIKKLDLQLQEKEEEFNSLSEQIEKANKELEKLFKIKAKAQDLAELEEKIASLENLWQKRQKQLEEEFSQEKAWREKRVEREEEEKRFSLDLKRRRLEQEIEQKEKDWQKKEKHYQELHEEVAKFPDVLEEEREKVSEEVINRLQREFKQEKEMLIQKHQASQQLLGEQTRNLREKVKEQEGRMKSLTTQLSEAHQKIKELAVAALEAKRPREEKSTSERASS